MESHKVKTRRHLLEYLVGLLSGFFCIVVMLLWLTYGQLQDQYEENTRLVNLIASSKLEDAKVKDLAFRLERKGKARKRAPKGQEPQEDANEHAE